MHEIPPRHLRHGHGTRHERVGAVEHGGVVRGVGRRGMVVEVLFLRSHLSCRFVMEVGHQHCRSLKVSHTITACFYLFQCGRIHAQRRFRGGRRRLRGCLGRRTPLVFGDERGAAIFGMNGPVVSQQQVPTDKRAATFHAFEGAFLGVCMSPVTVSMCDETWPWSDQDVVKTV